MYLSEINGDRAVRRIDMTPLKRYFTDNLNMLLQLIDSYGFKIRITGGFVRDVLLGFSPRDIDLVTDAHPDAIMFILNEHDISYVTRGLKHGTIKAKFPNEEEYEITSTAFAIDQECCPPHLIVNNGGSWLDDAKRRDFSIDTLSLDMDGRLYDYMNGMSDLRNQYVRFIGSASERIQKEPILLMRFFKLLSLFKNPRYDKALIPILQKKMKLIKKIKPTRMQHEIENIRRGQNAEKVIRMMSNLGFDAVIDEINEESLISHQLCEVNLMAIVPAIKVVTDQQPQYFIGHRGQTHADVWETIPPEIAMNENMESGFWDTEEKKFLTRAEAFNLVNAGESFHLRRLQHANA